MSAASRLTRMLALVPWLVDHPGVSMAACAAHFQITVPQLERDLFALIVSGDEMLGPGRLVDIQFWTDDDGGEPVVRANTTIEVLDAQALERPMRLTTAEATAVLLGLRLLEQLPGPVEREAISTAAAKVEIAMTRSAAAAGPLPIGVDSDVRPEVRSAIDDALAGDAELDITYGSAASGAITHRRIVPAGILAVDGIGYLDAYCRFAGARRTFRLDRIVAAMPAWPESAADPSAVDEPAGEQPEHPEDTTGAPDAFAVLDLTAAARWVVEVHRGTIVAEYEDGGVRARIGVYDWRWAVRLVLSLAGSAVVVEPRELADSVVDAAFAALAAYADA